MRYGRNSGANVTLPVRGDLPPAPPEQPSMGRCLPTTISSGLHASRGRWGRYAPLWPRQHSATCPAHLCSRRLPPAPRQPGGMMHRHWHGICLLAPSLCCPLYPQAGGRREGNQRLGWTGQLSCMPVSGGILEACVCLLSSCFSAGKREEEVAYLASRSQHETHRHGVPQEHTRRQDGGTKKSREREGYSLWLSLINTISSGAGRFGDSWTIYGACA